MAGLRPHDLETTESKTSTGSGTITRDSVSAQRAALELGWRNIAYTTSTSRGSQVLMILISVSVTIQGS